MIKNILASIDYSCDRLINSAIKMIKNILNKPDETIFIVAIGIIIGINIYTVVTIGFIR